MQGWKMQDWQMRDRNARVENVGASSMESCLQKRVSMLSYRRANVLRVFFHGLNYTALKRNFN